MLSALLVSALLAQVPNPPATFTLNDSYYGDVAMTRTAPDQWSGVNVVTLPRNPCCDGPVTFALHYTLWGDASGRQLTTQYRTTNFTTNCPAASAPSDPVNRSHTSPIDLRLRNPATGRPGTTFAVNGATPGTQCWPAFRGVTLSLVLP